LQADRRRKGKNKIWNWERMIFEFKSKFMPKDYKLNLFRELQNLKQKVMTVKEYTKEFYRLTIRAGHIEENVEKVARYINGLSYDIQDEIIIFFLKKVEDSYQATLKAEKLAKKKAKNSKEEVQQEAKENPVEEEHFRLQKMKEEAQAQVVIHQEEENQEAEYISLEEEVEEPHVEILGICHGIVRKAC
jgi:hypothetical protein